MGRADASRIGACAARGEAMRRGTRSRQSSADATICGIGCSSRAPLRRSVAASAPGMGIADVAASDGSRHESSRGRVEPASARLRCCALDEDRLDRRVVVAGSALGSVYRRLAGCRCTRRCADRANVRHGGARLARRSRLRSSEDARGADHRARERRYAVAGGDRVAGCAAATCGDTEVLRRVTPRVSGRGGLCLMSGGSW